MDSPESEIPDAAKAGRRRVTSVDVAREAGVSRATVSFVLNDTPNTRIPQGTRDRVWDAARRLDYAPSAAARTLRSGHSDVVLWLMPDWPTGASTARTIDQLAASLAEAGFTLVVQSRAGGTRPISSIWRSVSPRAVLLWESSDVGEVAAMRAAGAEVVLTMSIGAGPASAARRSAAVGFDIAEQRTGRVQVEHLAVQGHRRIGYAYPDDPRLLTFAEPRLAGARSACAELGLDAPDCQIVGLDVSRAVEAVGRWRSGPDAVTGVCAYNDEVAFAVLAGLRAHALRAPGDLAVIGVDNHPIAHLADPPLTSVYGDTSMLVDYIVRALLAGFAGQPTPRPPGSDLMQLAVRESA